MGSLERPNLSDHRFHVSSTENLHSTTTQERPSHRQQRETQDPFILRSSPSPHHTFPPPALIPNQPAPWQLGRHSQYILGARNDQKSSPLSGQHIYGNTEWDDPGRWNSERVHHQVNQMEEAGLRDVEEELHRGLKARQVKPTLDSERAGPLTPL